MIWWPYSKQGRPYLILVSLWVPADVVFVARFPPNRRFFQGNWPAQHGGFGRAPKQDRWGSETARRFGRGRLRHSFAKERALLRLRRQVCPTKLPFYAGYSEIVLRCNATSEVEQPRRRKRRPKQENQNSNGFSYNPTKTLKRCWTRFAQPRLQRFSFKKKVFFKKKTIFWRKCPCFFTAPAVAKIGNAIFALISKIFGLLITIKPWLQFRRKYTHTVSHRKDIHDCWISSAYLSLFFIIPFDHWFIIILPELAWSDARS